ncbi:MAG: LOG family protein [Roseovarius sp.]|nr:LOG family protein [Roseovarius sp.]MCY4209070.1 LOG family protein [Roseovarius sp.]MCY4290597.1 LOG family protein [Roseovarius sp.]
MKDKRHSGFRDAHSDRSSAEQVPDTAQTRDPAYRLAFLDQDFLMRDDLRPARLQLELLKPEIILNERGIESTVVLFGGSRIPNPVNRKNARTRTLAGLSEYYDEAREFAKRMTEKSMSFECREYVVATGGGPGIMEAGNRGAADAGGISIGLNIVLPLELAPNEYVTPGLCFNFHYFALRKMHFLMRARAIGCFPGGYGTMDELFETLTLMQMGHMKRVPLLLFSEKFWKSVVNFNALADAGTINPEDLELFRFVETADQAVEAIEGWYSGQV